MLIGQTKPLYEKWNWRNKDYMRTMYCGFDDESLMKAYAAFGLPIEKEFILYERKEMCESKYAFMLSVDVTNYPLKMVELATYMAMRNIAPYDILQMFYNKPIDIRLENKPDYLYHASPLYHLPFILHDGFIRKSCLTGDYINTLRNYVFTFDENKKSDCLSYTNGTGALFKIQTDRYRVINAQNKQFGIVEDVNIDDVVNIEFYLDLTCVTEWDKKMIKKKASLFKERYDYTKNDHNITYKHRFNETINNKEAYEYFNEWIF